MTVDLEIPGKEMAEKYVKLGLAGIGLAIVIKLTAKIVSKIHEKKQDRKIKKLENRVSELESKVKNIK